MGTEHQDNRRLGDKVLVIRGFGKGLPDLRVADEINLISLHIPGGRGGIDRLQDLLNLAFIHQLVCESSS